MNNNQEVTNLQIYDLIQLIARCDAMIKNMLEAGMSSDTIMIKQELLLKHRYCEELNAIFRRYEANIYILEEDLKLAA